MDYSKAEREVIFELGSQLHFEETGQPLAPSKRPSHEATWRMFEILNEAEVAVIDLLNEA